MDKKEKRGGVLEACSELGKTMSEFSHMLREGAVKSVCPKCKSKMIQIVFPQEQTEYYIRCKDCGSVFLEPSKQTEPMSRDINKEIEMMETKRKRVVSEVSKDLVRLATEMKLELTPSDSVYEVVKSLLVSERKRTLEEVRKGKLEEKEVATIIAMLQMFLQPEIKLLNEDLIHRLIMKLKTQLWN